jgi:hypothetical protein
MDVIYWPELDFTAELNPNDTNYYQSIIGTFRLASEIGRVDKTTEESMSAAHMTMPVEVHLDAVLRYSHI